MVEAAVKACADKQPTDTSSFLEGDETVVTLMMRALRRGKIIAETTPDEKAVRRKSVYVRQRDKDHDVNQVHLT